MEEYLRLDEETKAIDEQMEELWRKRDSINKEADRQYMKYAQRDVGRCFKVKREGGYVKITGTPEPEKYSIHYELNRYKYPAFFLNDPDDEGYISAPFEYSYIWASDFVDDNYCTEISPEEFNAEFMRRVNKLVGEVAGRSKEAE